MARRNPARATAGRQFIDTLRQCRREKNALEFNQSPGKTEPPPADPWSQAVILDEAPNTASVGRVQPVNQHS